MSRRAAIALDILLFATMAHSKDPSVQVVPWPESGALAIQPSVSSHALATQVSANL